MPVPPAAPTIVQQGRAFGSSSTTGPHADLYPTFLGDRIHKWWSDRWPMVSAVQKIRSKPVFGPVWYHFEHQPLPRYATATATATATGGAITFTNHFTRFNQYDVWMNLRTWELVLVTDAIGSIDATVGVTRAWGQRPGQAVLVGDRFKKIGSASGETETAREAVSTVEDKFTFRSQDFRDSIELSSRLNATRLRVEPKLLRRLRSEKFWQHKSDISDSFWFGGLQRTQAAAGERTGSMGLMEHIKTNTWNVNGKLTYGDLASWVSTQIAPWNQQRVLTINTSAHVKQIIASWALEKIQVQAQKEINSWGLEIDNIVLIGGRRCVIMEESVFNESPEMQGMMFVGSPNLAAWRGFDQDLPHGGMPSMQRTTKLVKNIKREDNPTLYKEEIFTSGGWEFWAERAWGFAWNVTH